MAMSMAGCGRGGCCAVLLLWRCHEAMAVARPAQRPAVGPRELGRRAARGSNAASARRPFFIPDAIIVLHVGNKINCCGASGVGPLVGAGEQGHGLAKGRIRKNQHPSKGPGHTGMNSQAIQARVRGTKLSSPGGSVGFAVLHRVDLKLAARARNLFNASPTL
jgi:hypothetical protein